MPTDPALLQPFDYKPVLKIQGERSFAVGFAPTHSNLGIEDMNGRRFRLSCPPAMMLVKMDIDDELTYGSIAVAISAQALEIVARVMLDFRHRPATLLRGVSLSTRGIEPTTEAQYIAQLGEVLAHGDPTAVQPVQFMDLSELITESLRGAALLDGPHGSTHRENVEKGILILREAAERDAMTAMSTVSGEKRDFEREIGGSNRDEVESILAACARRNPYGTIRENPKKGSQPELDDRYALFPDKEPGNPDFEEGSE